MFGSEKKLILSLLQFKKIFFKPKNKINMKKIFTLIVSVIFVYTLSYGQSQRLVLCEEFTQASCPPCAAQNPAYNTLLNANPTKVVAIKHQTSWPGVDPMNAQNP